MNPRADAQRRILVVDDNDEKRNAYTARILADIGAVRAPILPLVAAAKTGVDALHFLKAARDDGVPFHVLVTDLIMSPYYGTELIKKLRPAGFRPRDLDVVLISTEDAAETMAWQIKEATQSWLGNEGEQFEVRRVFLRDSAGETEDARRSTFLDAIWRSIYEPRPSRCEGDDEVVAANDDAVFVTRHEPLLELLRRLRTETQYPIPKLLYGEAGTGKERLVVKLIEESARRGKKFLPINCAELRTDVMQSELFGHEAGAFTGAAKFRQGLFETADGGTVFLDEIQELTPELQTKLNRVIENGEVRRLGASEARRVDVWVIAATNRDPSTWMNRDLYDRFGGELDLVRIPPLRDRPEDVRPLTEYFWTLPTNTAPLRSEPWDRSAYDHLREQKWLANGRGLRSAIFKVRRLLPRGQPVTRSSLKSILEPREDSRAELPFDSFSQALRHSCFYPVLQSADADHITLDTFEHFGSYVVDRSTLRFGNAVAVAKSFKQHMLSCAECEDMWHRVYRQDSAG